MGHVRLTVAAALALCALSSSASVILPNGAGALEYVSGGVRIVDGVGAGTFIGRNSGPGPAGAATVNDTMRIPLAGRDLVVTSSRTVPRAAILTAGALAVRALPAVAVGVALWDMWDSVRVRPDGSGGLVLDEGVPQESVGGFRCGIGFEGATAFEACSLRYPGTTPECTDGGSTITCYNTYIHHCLLVSGGPHYQCTWYQRRVVTTKSTGAQTIHDPYNQGTLTASAQTITRCPASVDALNPANSLPAGLPVGPDGLCRTGRYNTPIAAPDAAARLGQFDPPGDAELPGLVDDILSRGQPIEGASPRTLSGPPSSAGQPTTTVEQKPNGGTITTTKTPTIVYTYEGDQVTWNITTTTVINNEGDVTTITESTAPEPAEDECARFPERIGCAKLGDIDDESPQWQTRDVPLTVLDLGFSGACPAPVTWSVFGLSLTWGYQPVCDVAPMIRVAFLLMASIASIGIVVRETSA